MGHIFFFAPLHPQDTHGVRARRPSGHPRPTMDQICLDPQDKLTPLPPFEHVVNKTPPPPQDKKSACGPPTSRIISGTALSEVDKLVRIYLTIPVTTATGGKVLFYRLMHQNLPETYHVPAAPQQHNAPQCPQGSDEWIGFAHHLPSPGSSWTPMNAAGISLALCTVHSETYHSDRG